MDCYKIAKREIQGNVNYVTALFLKVEMEPSFKQTANINQILDPPSIYIVLPMCVPKLTSLMQVVN
jgi:hypothetical protein